MKRSIVIGLIVVFGVLGLHLREAITRPVGSAPTEIHCKHFIHGYPLGVARSNDLIIRDLYALSSNDARKFADWVCYYLTHHEVNGDLDLERKWRTDTWLEADETLEATPSSKDDYRGVGNEEASDPNGANYDRGHQAPLASFKGSRFASQVNYYSNITPQRPALNQGTWKRLESKVRNLVLKFGSAWVMTGPLYESEMPPLPNCDESHTVPSGYWKIIIVDESGTIRVAAFIMNQDTARSAKILDQLVTIDAVEERSGLNFLWKLPDDKEDALESVTFNSWVQEWFD